MTNKEFKFETGATSSQANNLIRAVLNDGQACKDRLHCGFAMLQGSYHRLTIKDIVTAEANKQRKDFGNTFPAKTITEAVKILTAETISNCLEIIKEEYIGTRAIDCLCNRWFDKINGNSYFSVNIQIPCKSDSKPGEVIYRQVNIPFSYGYGSQWEHESIALLQKVGILPAFPVYENGGKDTRTLYDWRQQGIIKFIDSGYMNKNKMFNGLYL